MSDTQPSSRCEPLAAIVLAGGHSRRMGQPKALLPFGDETLLARVVRIASEVCHPVVVVQAADSGEQDLLAAADVKHETLIAHDAAPDHGPLEGILAGLERLEGLASAAFVCGCDVPLLETAFITALAQLAEQNRHCQIIAPHVAGRQQPLSAIYRLEAIPAIRAMLAKEHYRARDVLSLAATLLVDAEELRKYDPRLGSLENVNHADEYVLALRAAGLAPHRP